MNTNHLDSRALLTSGLAEQIARSVSEPWLAYLQKRQDEKQQDRQMTMQERQFRKPQLADALQRAQTLGVAPSVEDTSWMRDDGGAMGGADQAAIAAAQALFQKQKQRETMRDQVSLAQAVGSGQMTASQAAAMGMDPATAMAAQQRFAQELGQRRVEQESRLRSQAANVKVAEANAAALERKANPPLLDRMEGWASGIASNSLKSNESMRKALNDRVGGLTAMLGHMDPEDPDRPEVVKTLMQLLAEQGGVSGAVSGSPIAPDQQQPGVAVPPAASPQRPVAAPAPPVVNPIVRDVINQESIRKRAEEMIADHPRSNTPVLSPDDAPNTIQGTLDVLASRLASKEHIKRRQAAVRALGQSSGTLGPVNPILHEYWTGQSLESAAAGANTSGTPAVTPAAADQAPVIDEGMRKWHALGLQNPSEFKRQMSALQVSDPVRRSKIIAALRTLE